MIKVNAQTFSTASRTKYETNIRVSDLFDNLHSFLRFYKNNYTIRIIIRIIIRHNKYCLNFLTAFRNRTVLVFLISKGDLIVRQRA